MKLLDAFLELLYPSRCVFCRRLTKGPQEKICPQCLKSLPYTPPAAQFMKFPFLLGCCAPLYYEGVVRESLLRYKFQGAAAYAKVYGELLSKCIDENGFSCDIITWAPLSRRRLRHRGYDQARLIAEETAKLLGIPCARLLKKTRNNPAQSGTGSAEKRRANVAGVYEMLSPTLAGGGQVLVVDDIVTTGATLSECARVLRVAGCAGVYAAAVARRRE